MLKNMRKRTMTHVMQKASHPYELDFFFGKELGEVLVFRKLSCKVHNSEAVFKACVVCARINKL